MSLCSQLTRNFRLSFGAILVFFLFYFFGASYTAGAGISTGTFVPMIVIGAAYGRMIGVIVRYVNLTFWLRRWF